MFAKSMGIFIAGYVYWLLSCAKLLKFTGMNCMLVLVLCALVNYGVGFLLYKKDKKKCDCHKKDKECDCDKKNKKKKKKKKNK